MTDAERVDALKKGADFVAACAMNTETALAAALAAKDELEARLAMVVEAAIQYRRSFNQSGQGIVAVNQAIDAACELCKSIEAAAPTTAAFLQRVEDRGAAKELRKIADKSNLFPKAVREWAEGRIIELREDL